MSHNKKAKPNRFYLAYGSNLSVRQMARRCPDALKIGKSTLFDHRLVFKSVADVEPCQGENVQVGLWKITRECERTLDLYEGVKSGLYLKRYVVLQIKRKGVVEYPEALLYVMRQEGGYHAPWLSYFDGIKEGYGDFGMDVKPLFAARDWTIEESKKAAPAFAEMDEEWNDANPNEYRTARELSFDDEEYWHKIDAREKASRVSNSPPPVRLVEKRSSADIRPLRPYDKRLG